MTAVVALIAALLLMAPSVAQAAPVVAAAAAWWAAASITAVVALAVRVAVVVYTVYGSIASRRRARNQAARQRAAYNASLEDRSVTLLQAAPPLRVIYGRCIVGGDVVAEFTSDKTGVKENGSTYTKADAYKHLVIVLAAHEVEAIDDVLIDGVSVGALDGSGWTTAGEFYRAGDLAMRSTTVAAGGFTDVSPAVVAIVDSYIENGSGVDATFTSQTVTLSLGNTRITNPGASTAFVSYTVSTAAPLLKVDKHLGTAAQTVDTYLNSVKPSQWTTNHRLRGLAYVVVTLDLEEPRFQAGPPQITFDVRGKKVLDTRTSTTAWSENPALIVRDFLTSVYGFGVAAADIDVAACNAAANACDARVSATTHSHATTFTADASTEQITCASDRWFATGDGVRLTTTGTLPGGLATATTYYVIATASRTVFKLATSVANAFAGTAINITSAGSGTHTVTWHDYATYTCHGAFATDGTGREAALDDLVATMGGQASYGGTWMISAGAWTSAVLALGDNDLDGQIEIVQAGEGLDSIINGLRGQYVPTGKATPVDFDPYSNATFVTADGRELWVDVALPFVGNKVRAKNLARILTERARAGLTIKYPAKLKAWPLQVGDRVTVTSAEYGWSSKTFRVTDWQFGASTAVQLMLQEDAASIYDLADAVVADPTPNTGLPNPWVVPAITGLAVASGTTHLIRAADGTIRTRALVSWNAVTSSYVRSGGAIEVAWCVGGSVDWTVSATTGDATGLYIDGLRDGVRLRIQVRAKNSLGAVGPIAAIGHTVVGKAQAPANVSGLTPSWVGGGVRFVWNANTEPDFAFTELRQGGTDWASASPLVGAATRVRGTEYIWAWPAEGAYTVRVRHRDTTGNYSAADATQVVSITPTEIALMGQQLAIGGNLLRNSSFEVDTNGNGQPDYWTAADAGSGLTFTRSQSTTAAHGRYSFQLAISNITSPTQAHHVHYQDLDATVLPKVQEGRRYIASAEFMPSTTSYKARLTVLWYGAGLGASLSGETINITLSSTTKYTRIWTAALTAPANAVYARVGVGILRPSTADTTTGNMKVDAALFMPADSSSGYWPADSVDGDLLPGSATEVVSAYDETETLTGTSVVADDYRQVNLCSSSFTNNSQRTIQVYLEAFQECECTVSSGRAGYVECSTDLAGTSSGGVTLPPGFIVGASPVLYNATLSGGKIRWTFAYGGVVTVPPGEWFSAVLALLAVSRSATHSFTVIARRSVVRILALKTSS